jgi:hypothetical protein
MPSGMTDLFKTDLMTGNVDLNDGDVIKVALFESDYPFTEGDTTYTAVAAARTECTGAGYTLAGETATYITGGTGVTIAANVAKWDIDDTPWGPGATIGAIRNALIYSVTNSQNIIANVDFGSDQSVSSGTFTIVWNVNGVVTLT